MNISHYLAKKGLQGPHHDSRLILFLMTAYRKEKGSHLSELRQLNSRRHECQLRSYVVPRRLISTNQVQNYSTFNWQALNIMVFWCRYTGRRRLARRSVQLVRRTLRFRYVLGLRPQQYLSACIFCRGFL